MREQASASSPHPKSELGASGTLYAKKRHIFLHPYFWVYFLWVKQQSTTTCDLNNRNLLFPFWRLKVQDQND